MFSRRTTLKMIASIFAAVPFASRTSLACDPTGPYEPEIIYTPKMHLLSFYEGKFNDFLNREYKNRWNWSDEIAIRGSHQPKIYDDLNIRKTEQALKHYHYMVENYFKASVNVSSILKYDESKIYCSKIDIIYADERSGDFFAIYIIAAISLGKNAIPFYATRFRMTSNKPKIYAALTFSDVSTNDIVEVKVSSLPATYKHLSCVPYEFWYSDA